MEYEFPSNNGGDPAELNRPGDTGDPDEAADFDHDVLHGEEAAEWVPVGRRAFLKQLTDD